MLKTGSRPYQIGAVLLALTLTCIDTLAATGSYKAKVLQVQTHSRNFGGCMAKLQPGPESVAGVSCKAGWVSFSCSGDYGTKAEGKMAFDVAQLAMIRNKNVFLVVDDGYKHNGYCYSPRIDTYR